MTEDSKQNLLDFMLGQIIEEEGDNQLYFDTVKKYKNDFKTKIQEEIPNFELNGTVASQTNELLVCWGVDLSGGASFNAYIIILDRKFNIIKIFDSFESGTKFENIMDIKINSDGQFFMLEASRNADDNWQRLVMMNDLTDYSSGDYHCELRQSYQIPSEYLDYNYERVDKALNNSYYAFVGPGKSNSTNYGVLTLKVNVGTENEWRFTYRSIGAHCTVRDTLLVWSDVIQYTIYLDGNNNHFYEIFVGESDNNLYSNLIDIDCSNSEWSYTIIRAIKSLGNQNVYAVIAGISIDETHVYQNLYKLNYSTNKFDLISELESHEIGYSMELGYAYFQVDKSNNLYLGLINRNEGEETLKGQIFMITYENNLNLISTSKFEIDDFKSYAVSGFIISQTFELNTLTLQYNDYCIYTTMQILNNGYNGQPYTDRSSLNSTAATVYSEGEKVFTRSLYNKSINANTTNSTLEIPAAYLNNVSIGVKNLLSKNNNTIISDEKNYEKNIYENVYFNFMNTIYVQDRNSDISIINQSVSNQLTSDINNPINYENHKLTKFRINYADGMNTVAYFNISKGNLTYNINFGFILEKEASTLELISEDEQTVYLSTDISNLQINHVYSFSQDVTIE